MDGFATIAEIAEELRVSDEHVRQLCLSGELGAERYGRAWRIPRSELQAFRAKSRWTATGSGDDSSQRSCA